MMASCMMGFQPCQCFVCFFLFHLAKMCNTVTVHHKANRLVTQRHIVKTDIWLRWASRGVFFFFLPDFRSVYLLNSQRNDKSNSKIRFVPGPSMMRLTANDQVLVLADCLHLVEWGGTGASGNKLPWGTTAPEHRDWICFFRCKPYN